MFFGIGIWTEQVIKQLIAERTKLSKEFMYAKKRTKEQTVGKNSKSFA